MKRRDFIRIGGFLTASVATLGLTGCSIDGEDDESSLFPPATPEPVRAIPAAATGATWKFPQSIASADPRPDSIILWTRVVPTTVVGATASSNVNTAIRLVVTAADNSANIGTITALSGTLVADVTVPAYADFDNSVRHKLTGLSAASVYYYQFIAGDIRSNVGRFKTAPAIASSDDVKFIFMSCQDWSANHWGAFDQIVADDATPAAPDVDFIVHLGDYIYETDSVAAAESSLHSAVTLPVGASLPTGGNYAVELADYRYLYKLYRSDTRIQKVHERFPIVAVWDDHEFSDDGWQTAETYTNTNSPMFQRRRNANQAWFEFMPADVSFSEVDPSFQNIKLYRDLKFGATMHLVMTDERLYRQDHLIPESTINPATGLPLGRINSRYLAPEASLKSAELQKDFAGAPLGPLGLISILGQTQRDWWKSTMLNSTSTWKVWGNEVSLLRMGLNGTNALASLISLSVIGGTPATMNAKLSDPQVQALPKVAAGAGAAIIGGATAAIAIPATFAILQTYAATGNPATAIGAGVSAGLTTQQATDALNAIAAKTPTAAEIGICATTVVAATTAYMTLNLSQATASTTAAGGVIAMILTDQAAGGAAPDANLLAAIKGSSSLSNAAGTIVVNVYQAAKAAAGSGQTAQVNAAAGAFVAGSVMFQLVMVNIRTYTTTSSFFIAAMASADASGGLPAGTSAAKVIPFFQKFMINADQWDGYRKERSNLMNHLLDNSINNVVAVTGDIHAFFAGEVYNEFAGEITSINTVAGSAVEATASTGGTAVMVDLVAAGISSTSWFEYIKAAADGLDPTNSLIGKLVYVPVPVALPANALFAGSPALSFTLNLNLLDYTMGKAVPATTTALAAQLNGQLKQKLAAGGIPEVALDASAAGVQAQIAGSGSFASALSLAQALATTVAANPWLKHIDTEAQGYGIVTASTGQLQCQFKKLNPIVGTSAPSSTRRVVSTTTATVTAGAPAVVIS